MPVIIFVKLFIFNDLWLAERVGFEPTCRLPDNTLSRRARYDHFGTSPVRCNSLKQTCDYTAEGSPSETPAGLANEQAPCRVSPTAARRGAL